MAAFLTSVRIQKYLLLCSLTVVQRLLLFVTVVAGVGFELHPSQLDFGLLQLFDIVISRSKQ